jgi:hypothetical protein
MRERRIGLAVIVLLLIVLGTRQAPLVELSASVPAEGHAIEVRAAVDLGATAGALLFTWTIDHLGHAR